MVPALHQLARLYGIQRSYHDVTHRLRRASTHSLLAVLKALGAPVEGLGDVPDALRERRLELWRRPVEPVVVCWDGTTPAVDVRLPSPAADGLLRGHVTLESGQQGGWSCHGADLPVLEAAQVEGTQYVTRRLPLPEDLPWGYHRLTLELPGRGTEALIVRAPLRAYAPQDGARSRTWGVFLPLYSMHSQRSRGSGDLSDLESLAQWVAGLGGGVVATLPLLASFLDDPFDPSPYAPASRLLWNEFYVDVTRAPELERCPPAQSILGSDPFRQAVEELGRASLVDYRRQMSLKRQVLVELARCFFSDSPGRHAALQGFLHAHPEVADYARFRATMERQRQPWPAWPSPLREGILKPEDYDEEIQRSYLYAQWLAHEQVRAASEKARARGVRLYFDMPLGVHPAGYDVWQEREVFVSGVSAGAPPDAVFTTGQTWHFPPMHPDRLREQGYRYYIACLRHQLQSAGILRIDHVMGFHRLFWIPGEMRPSEGVYVRYRPEEFYAILALESQRHRAIIVGEDLGTVPPQVRPAMDRHGLHHTYVVQYELACNPHQPLQAVPENAVASLNTHDMPPFAAFWQGLDIGERQELGLLDHLRSCEEQECRRVAKESLVAFLHHGGHAAGEAGAEPEAALKPVLAFLSASPARVALVNLEDLYGETNPQNVPGTLEEGPNWRRKARYPLETLYRLPQVLDALAEVNRARRKGIT